VQNYEGGSKLIKHNILFDQKDYNLHAYGSSTAGFMNSRVEGNVWWRGTSLVGGESGFDIGGTSVTGNFSWAASLNMGYYTTNCANVTVSGNYLTNLGGLVFWAGSSGCQAGETITGNTFIGDLKGFTPSASRTTRTMQHRSADVRQGNDPSERVRAGRATIVV
jgi:hypothetical protein